MLEVRTEEVVCFFGLVFKALKGVICEIVYYFIGISLGLVQLGVQL